MKEEYIPMVFIEAHKVDVFLEGGRRVSVHSNLMLQVLETSRISKMDFKLV